MLRIICIWALTLPLCAFADPPHEYTVSIAAGLTSLTVEARFTEPVTRLSARSRDAARFLRFARSCDNRALPVRGRQLRLPQGGIDCLRYQVDLASAAENDERNAALHADNIVVAPAVWLWRPKLGDTGGINLSFSADGDTRVSVPWLRIDKDTYQLARSPGSGRAVSAFGSFTYSERQVAGGKLRIAMLKPRDPFDFTEIEDWLASTAGNVALTYGRFPSPSPQVLVIPVGNRSSSPVIYGRVLRDGGESIELFINESRPIDEFYDDWTATHEFSHLLLPYVTIRQRWVSEGFAQYYQNVLLARAGIYDPQRAWQKLYEGLERGRRSRPELSPNAASKKGIREALMKVYWSGASMALMADVEIRRRSNGIETLDTVLDRLQRCCLPSDHVWSGEELFSKLDYLLDDPVFMPLYRRYADAPGFPDYRPVFEALGLDIQSDIVVLDDNARFSAIRDAITGTPQRVTSRDQ